MKDVYTELVEGIRSVDARTKELGKQFDALIRLMKDAVPWEGRIERVEEKIVEMGEMLKGQLARMEAGQVISGKLVDRLIEMAMVVKGQGDQAVLHRAQASRDPKGFEAWNDEEEKEETWPPEGADCMDIRG